MVALLELGRNSDEGDLHKLSGTLIEAQLNGFIRSRRGATSTDATPIVLKGSTALGSLFIPNNCIVTVGLRINAAITSSTGAGTPGSNMSSNSWWRIVNNAGAFTIDVVIPGPDTSSAFSVRSSPDADNWLIALVDNGTPNFVDIQVTGDTDQEIFWAAIAEQDYVRFF